MISLDSVLVVEDSRVVREVVRAVLAPHAKRVLVAGSVEEARELLAETPDLALLLSDVRLPDGTGLDLLAELPGAAPAARAILMTARWEQADADRATQAGALAYLAKPVAFRDIARALRKDAALVQARPARRRSLGRALLKEAGGAGASHLIWELRDLSITGAFLETKGPIPVGTSLSLELMLGDATAEVTAVVVRVQDPSWAASGGIGVRFAELDAASRAVIQRQLAEAESEAEAY